jgi:hypothetical protein
MDNDTLAAKVTAINTANTYANQLYKPLANIFTLFIGDNILKADNTLLKKIETLLPEFPNTPRLHVYKHSSIYSLVWTVTSSCNYSDCSCVYHEADVYIGHLKKGILISLYDEDPVRADYTVEEVLAKREIAKKAREAYNKAKSDLGPFSE